IVATGNIVSTALGKGDATFGTWLRSSQVLPIADRIAAGDFDPDVKIDVVTISRNDSLGFMTGYGDGMFSRVNEAIKPNTPLDLAVIDFDLDDKLDVVTLSGAETVQVFIGQGARKLAVGPMMSAGAL